MNIEELFNIDYNWGDLIVLTAILAAIYGLLLFVRKIISSVVFVGKLRTTIKRIIEVFLILYEPLSILVIVSIFIMIKPAFHSLMAGILGIMGFEHIRNYFHGRLILSNRALKIGRHINIIGQEGIITDLDRMGLKIRSNDGLHYLPYHTLVTKGYILSSGDKIGGYYDLCVTPSEQDSKINHLARLSDILISSPYLDGDHKPEITRSIESGNVINVKLLVKEESHYQDLIAVLEEYGYHQLSK